MRDRNRLSLGQGIPVEIENAATAAGAMATAIHVPAPDAISPANRDDPPVRV
jgi:hypothetical protein